MAQHPLKNEPLCAAFGHEGGPGAAQIVKAPIGRFRIGLNLAQQLSAGDNRPAPPGRKHMLVMARLGFDQIHQRAGQ